MNKTNIVEVKNNSVRLKMESDELFKGIRSDNLSCLK